MAKEKTQINWKHIIKLHNSHEGKLVDFCKEHGITRNQLYYHRSKENKEKPISFHLIKINSKDSLDLSNKKTDTALDEIKISIGKANIHIPTSEKDFLIDILKELM